jgi:histidinol-phosphate aminotransferase
MPDVLRALLDARLNPALRQQHAYVPDPVVVPIRLDANEAPPLLATLDESERAIWNDALLGVEPARYPDVRASSLRAAIATRLGVEPSQLVLGCGTDEVISILLSTLRHPLAGAPPSVLVPTPTFVMYRMAARIQGYDVIEVPLDAKWDLDEQAMLHAIASKRPAVIFLATPNNPTSGVFDRGRVLRVVEAAARCDPPSLVVIDEAYLPFRLGADDPWGGRTGLDDLRAHGHVLVLRTLSKVGLAALRVGWAVAHPTLAAELEKVRLPYNLPATSQAGAAAALGPLATAVDRHVASIVDERARLLAALSHVEGVSHERTDGNFVWLRLPKPAPQVVLALKRDGVLVRTFPAHPSHVRVTVGTPTEDDRFLEALRSALR